ncbi:MAG TPA: hypothetical protein PLV04_14280 [Phenylobacterium sp.]|nr:hypothetical protein [Phenylobacterium sp.]HQN50407.1 hypothetical protein [Phenylobacterium sp.]HQP19092.1 hypothetical protein [Phenylobacterium sp.]
MKDLPNGDAKRTVDAEHVTVAIGSWQHRYDGTSALFLLWTIYEAALVTLMEGTNYSFFCLDDPDGGRVYPSTTGRLLIELRDGSKHDVSGIEVLRASFEAIAQILEFLADAGYPEATPAMLSDLMRPRAKL